MTIIDAAARSTTFEARERARQVRFLDETIGERAYYQNSACRLVPEQKTLNLAPSIRDVAPRYFVAKNITWHTHANHALSSQVCCLNFLMPLAEQPDRLARLVGRALGIEPPAMLPVEDGPDGRPWFVGFEWNGAGRDYLNEGAAGGTLKRGSNSTSADAVVRFQGADGPETLLIEWKYTETYGAPIAESGNATRTKRYEDLAFAPNGPVRADLGLALANFFFEPFYQLLRQQMLAYQMEKAGEHEARRVRVLHISPTGNTALHRVTSPVLRRFGTDAFEVFRSLLVRPDQFVNRSTEELFRPLVDDAGFGDEWGRYIAARYRFVFDDPASAPVAAAETI